MGLLELGGWNVAEARVKLTGVVPVDPASGRELDVADGLVGPVVEHRRADALSFEEPVDRLHQRDIEGISDGPDRRGDALEVEVLGVPDRRVLRSAVAS